MESMAVTRIPVPSVILKNDWYGIVYAIDTVSETAEAHATTVEKCVEQIVSDYDSHSHYSVSLREVKRELVLSDDRAQHYCTLIQFRVRDSY